MSKGSDLLIIMDITIKNLFKTFEINKQTIEVLKEINLQIASGEFVVILGPSGSGKSTLLEIVAGLIPLDKGQVLVDGKPINGPGRERGMVFQEYALFPWRTVLGNLFYALDAQRIPREEWLSRCTNYLQMVKLWDFRDAYPNQLSGGMKQRVALARALVGEPSILLMDEPFAALDAITRHKLQIMLRQIIKKSSKTILFVTHSLEEAMFLGDRIVVLTKSPGRIYEEIDIPNNELLNYDLAPPSVSRLKQHIWSLLKSDGL
ncbi:MAG: ATP-binding cassette domain-containing protein [Nitrosopumilaceae archaeon]|nr:ABC transporter ATP-binding protein [Nitrosopumilaceae archaeon]NIX62119.1 ATP-binding cassette domain-containing protein [Nitrosopumilaceae archaeon]